MSIEVINIIPKPSGGGAEFIVRSLNERLGDFGIKSRALYLTNPMNVHLSENEHCLDLRVVRSIEAAVKVRHFLKNEVSKNTIIHAHLVEPFYFFSLGMVSQGRVKVFTEHSTHNRRREMFLFKIIDKFIYRKYNEIIAITDGAKTSLCNWVEFNSVSNVKVVQNGARIFSYKERLGIDEEKPIKLISIGSLNARKGFDVALKSVAIAGDKVEEYVIIGEGPERIALEQQACDLNISKKVKFVGWQDDIDAWLHSSDIQLIPSRWEGFGLVAVEGLSTGIPIVASNVSGLNEVLSNCEAAELVPFDDPDAIVNGIGRTLLKVNSGKNISAIARERAEQFGVDNMVAKYADLYRSLVAVTEHNA